MRKFWAKWQELARKIGDFQARFILIVLYFVVIGPFALIVRLAADPLSLKSPGQTGWRRKINPDEAPLKRALHQF
jgi:hypothetical protein